MPARKLRKLTQEQLSKIGIRPIEKTMQRQMEIDLEFERSRPKWPGNYSSFSCVQEGCMFRPGAEGEEPFLEIRWRIVGGQSDGYTFSTKQYLV